MFDHVGGLGIGSSFGLLRSGGTLVSYGSAATKDDAGASQKPILLLMGRLLWWNLSPNSRQASFYNFWAGHRRRHAFCNRLRDDLTQVLELLSIGALVPQIGALVPQIAAELPLDQAAAALKLAESRTLIGKVILLPPALESGRYT